jgi:translation initiation factor 2B subunit (eIF-2B alpha/beta/delta family)
LTLGNSGTIYTGILTLLMHLPTTHIHVTILESRPRFEGADLATNIFNMTPADAQHRLKVRVAPDCAVATVAKGVDIVLLGADRISSNGNVSNKMGSLAAVACTKLLQPNAKIVVLSDTDKIIAPNAKQGPIECHPPSELTKHWNSWTKEELDKTDNKVEVLGEWFEWVPKEFIDAYLTEAGIMDAGGVGIFGQEVESLEARLFS